MNKIVLVGRVNVGKSTLFNRLAENVRSITLDYEGVTRDFIKDRISWRDFTFDIIDSGGISLRKTNDYMLEKVREQVLELLKSVDAIVFVVDGVVGLLPEDREISNFLHRLGKPVIIAVNKIDTLKAEENVYEFEQLGHKDIVPISATHGRGINDLLDIMIEYLPSKKPQDTEEQDFGVTFLGRPNAGKSSLLNALLQEDRSLVSDIPGTTRESVSEMLQFYKRSIMLTDTPGIRKKKAVSGDLEPLMVKSAFQALKKSDIIVLLVDGSDSTLVDQELKLAFYAFEDHYKALIILINKTDIMTEEDHQALERNFEYYKHLMNKVPVLFISVKSGKNLGKILPLIQKTWDNYSRQFDKSELETLFITALQDKPLMHKKVQLKLFDVKQVAIAPITIKLTVNFPEWFGKSQLAFFENLLRSKYYLKGVPIKFILRKEK